MSETFTPAQVAGMLETDGSTIRRWCSWHAAHLSDSASPPPGGRRLLTAHDVEVLREVRRLRIAGLTTPAINEQLAHRTFAVVDSQTALTEPPQGAPGAQESALVVLRDVVGPLAARVEALEAQRQRVDVVFVAVAAFIAGLIVGLAVWWFQ